MANAILIWQIMSVTIDKLGRIVVPKPLRDRLGLVPGSELEVVERPDGFSLRVASRGPSMVKVDGLWVHQGTTEAGASWDGLLEDLRDGRAKSGSG
jgi:AbrB family looped-hinge helix DNA binding protein